MRFRSLAALGVAIAIVGTAACTDNSGPNGRAGGMYALTSVNGTPLPYSYPDQSTGNTITLQSDVYTLNSNATYTEVINETVSSSYGSSPTTDNESGNWSQNGTTVTFQPTYSSFNTSLTPYSGTLSSGSLFGNDALVFDSGSGQLVYQHE